MHKCLLNRLLFRRLSEKKIVRLQKHKIVCGILQFLWKQEQENRVFTLTMRGEFSKIILVSSDFLLRKQWNI